MVVPEGSGIMIRLYSKALPFVSEYDSSDAEVKLYQMVGHNHHLDAYLSFEVSGV